MLIPLGIPFGWYFLVNGLSCVNCCLSWFSPCQDIICGIVCATAVTQHYLAVCEFQGCWLQAGLPYGNTCPPHCILNRRTLIWLVYVLMYCKWDVGTISEVTMGNTCILCGFCASGFHHCVCVGVNCWHNYLIF